MKKLLSIAALVLFPLIIQAQNSLCPDNLHPHMIDLGLPSGTKWACCNVGANKPENYGEYFSWGETKSKNTYDDKVYIFCNGNLSKLTKYVTKSEYGKADNKTRLEMSNDVAYARWGGSWRIPTKAQLEELETYCTCSWTTLNNVKGRKFTSRKNGRSIFLPASGWCQGSSVNERGVKGDYWSSILYESDPRFSFRYEYTSGGTKKNATRRDLGLSVRPVNR